jgi:hypothetical protein
MCSRCEWPRIVFTPRLVVGNVRRVTWTVIEFVAGIPQFPDFELCGVLVESIDLRDLPTFGRFFKKVLRTKSVFAPFCRVFSRLGTKRDRRHVLNDYEHNSARFALRFDFLNLSFVQILCANVFFPFGK